MAWSGKVDVGCGVFTYNIVSPVKLVLGNRNCYDRSSFDLIAGVNGDSVKYYATLACANTKYKMMKRNDSSTFIHMIRGGPDKQPYQFNISWKDQCQLVSGAEEILVGDPLSGADRFTGDPCINMLYDNWRQCDNGGKGGNIQAGCLMYDFRPSSD